jgi:chemotaxis protein histidine kinase CheA
MSNQLELCVSSAVVEGVRVSMERYVLEVVEALSREYNFSASDASSKLGLVGVKVSVTDGSVGRKRKVVAKECVEKSAFPLPFMGRNVEECCQSLRQSQGLYTQCRNSKAGEKFCKSCSSKMVDGVPEYGTIEQRLAVGVNDYVDPSGRKVVHYTKIMKKYKVSEEQVIAEAKKLGQVVDGCHFIQPESDNVKRGRPKAEKPAKVSSGVKGRPKKTKKVVEIDGEEDDLFASLVAESINASAAVEVETINAEAVSEAEVEAVAKAPEVATKEKANKSEEKAAKLATKEQEKAAKLAAKEQEKAAKEQEKAAKEQEKAAKLAAKEQEKAAKEQEKAAKEQEKAAKLAAKSEAKSKKPAEKPAAPANDDTSAADVVKKIEFEGKKYLKSKKTGIVYDYDEYVKSGDQVVVGKWNEATNKLDFETAKSDGEESEDEYDEE